MTTVGTIPRMRRQSWLGATLFLAGCALLPKHEVNISPKLVEHPVHSLAIFDPWFPEKIKRASPQDLVEMLPEHQMDSAAGIRKVLTEVLGATVMVDTAYQPDRLAVEWSQRILADLAKGRVPLSVDPINLPVEAVLLIGAPTYGTEDIQLRMGFLWFKNKPIGGEKFEYVCDLEALLVNPHDGSVLFDVRNEYREKVHGPADPQRLVDLTRSCAGDIARALHPESRN